MSWLDFHQVIWLLPIVILAHVLEELPRFPGWAIRTLKVPYTRSKFVWENIVLFVILLGSVALAAFSPGGTTARMVGDVLVLGVAVGLFSNMLFHAIYTLKTGVYSPGTVTACLLFTPLSIHVYALGAAEGLLTLPNIAVSVVLGLSLLPIVVTVVHRLLDGKLRPRTLITFAVTAVLPPVLIGVAATVFDAAVVHKILVYGGPLALLPLALRWARPRKADAREAGPQSGGAR